MSMSLYPLLYIHIGPCPPVSTNGNIFQTQFDIECTTNPTAPADPPVWLQTPLGPPADQTPPDAIFLTASRTDCGLCINPRADNAPANVDPITHCSCKSDQVEYSVAELESGNAWQDQIGFPQKNNTVANQRSRKHFKSSKAKLWFFEARITRGGFDFYIL